MTPDVHLAAAGPALVRWSLVIPVKVLAQAKSRLTGQAGQRRSELALAMAADTVAMALQAQSVADVVVVTDDQEVGGMAAGLGALVLPDLPAAGLNEALRHGAVYSQARWPDRGRAGLAADLPAARQGELTAALARAARLGVAFVPDADGTGTTLYAAMPGESFRPQFGIGSRDRHLDSGAAEITAGAPSLGALDLAGLRRDVDTIDDLREAAAIGLGPRTLAVVSGDPGLAELTA
jgi:2-phospho-L-lactate/phosphoenolpyruvate guanylyltransferase